MMNTFPIRNTLLICALVGFSVFMSGLHRVPIPTVDGAIRAVEARFIIQTGQWFPIQNFEGVITDHPPLYIWLSALSMKIFGVTDFAVNFSQHFCGMLVVLLTGLIALEIGLGSFGAVVSVFILCLTRDFILSSVRGYIEPILELFSYLAVWHSIRAMKRDFHLHSILSGIFVFLAIFSKGPPAFWVFIFLSAYILVKNPKQIFYFLTGFLIMVLIFIFWTSVGGHWDVWKKYWFEQILSSALRGRDGAQGFEPFYFTSILVQYYIPWLPFLIYAIYKCVKNIKKTTPTKKLE